MTRIYLMIYLMKSRNLANIQSILRKRDNHNEIWRGDLKDFDGYDSKYNFALHTSM